RRATSLIAAHSEPCSSLISATIRTARSRSSGGYLLDEPPDMTPTFPRDGVSGHAGAIQCIRCTVWCGAHDRFKGVVGNPLEEIRVNSSRRYKVMNSVHCLRPFVVHVLQCSIETDGSHYEVVVMGAAGSGEPTPTMW